MDRFEGPEKKLEIILSDPQTGLRDNSDGRWDRVVRASGAEILKRKYGNNLDSYLLSESSLFVWDDRILIITCGRTTPVKALPVMLEFIAADNVAYLFYERKNLNFPDALITITGVNCSPDMKNAKIYVSVLPEKFFGSSLEQLRRLSSPICKFIMKNTRLRKVPKFTWQADDTEKNAAVIDEILNQIKNEDPE